MILVNILLTHLSIGAYFSLETIVIGPLNPCFEKVSD